MISTSNAECLKKKLDKGISYLMSGKCYEKGLHLKA
jgi:hypothetical protein